MKILLTGGAGFIGSHTIVELLNEKDTDIAIIYFDELNVANGWYLTGWCGQFEKGSVLVPLEGEPILLGGPESEPFAKMSSAITKVRCFPVFMVPEEEYPNATIIDFKQLYEELKAEGTDLKRIGFVGTATIPHQVYCDFQEGFGGIEHRMEFVKTVNGRSFYNDSKATNVDSAWYALDSMTTPVVWIAGGTDKGNDYSVLFDFFLTQYIIKY